MPQCLFMFFPQHFDLWSADHERTEKKYQLGGGENTHSSSFNSCLRVYALTEICPILKNGLLFPVLPDLGSLS